jgi:PKD domain
LQANGGSRADVAINQPVEFTATIEVPSNAGEIIALEWDFDGVGNYPLAERIDTPRAVVSLSVSHSFAKPGTYFSVLRATSQRRGDRLSQYGRIQNIARARVVVK